MALRDDLLDEMRRDYGPEATQAVADTVEFISDVIGVDRGAAELMKAGTLRMAEIVNDMLPALNTKRRTRLYDHRDLNGVMDPIPEAVQNTFVGLIGTLMLNANDGPFQAAMHLNDGIDQLADAWSDAK